MSRKFHGLALAVGLFASAAQAADNSIVVEDSLIASSTPGIELFVRN